MRTRTLGLLAVAATGLASADARADTPIALTWDAPSACRSRDEVLAEVQRLAGAASAGPALVAEGRIEHRRDGFHLRLVVRRESSERVRELRADTCDDLADAAALLLALTINPDARADRPPPVPPPRPPDPAPPAPPPEPAPPPRRPAAGPPPAPRAVPAESAKPEPSSLRALTSIGLDAGTFRGAVPWLRAGLAYLRPPLRLEMTGSLGWGGRITAPDVSTAGGDFWFGGGALGLCLERALDERIAGAACAGFEAGAVHARSFGVTGPDQATGPWLAPTLGAIGSVPLTRRLALRFSLDAAVPLVQLAFRIQGVGVVHRVGPVGARGGIGIEARIF